MAETTGLQTLSRSGISRQNQLDQMSEAEWKQYLVAELNRVQDYLAELEADKAELERTMDEILAGCKAHNLI